jgi:hypothetical protein
MASDRNVGEAGEIPNHELFHGMEDSIYNVQTSTLKTKDLEHSEPLRKCSGQGRTNDVTAPNCSGNPASKSTRRGHRGLDLVQPAITNLRHELTLSWPKIARQLGVSVRTVRTYAETSSANFSIKAEYFVASGCGKIHSHLASCYSQKISDLTNAKVTTNSRPSCS